MDTSVRCLQQFKLTDNVSYELVVHSTERNYLLCRLPVSCQETLRNRGDSPHHMRMRMGHSMLPEAFAFSFPHFNSVQLKIVSIIITEICKAPTLRLKELNKHRVGKCYQQFNKN